MSVENRLGPIEYLTSTFVLTTGFAVVIAALTSGVIYLYQSADPRFGGYAVVAVLSFALVLSQLAVQGELQTNNNEPSLAYLVVAFLMTLIYYNLLVFVSVYLAWVGFMLGGQAVGLFLAVLWPAWEIASARNMIPLSLTGVMVWAAVFAIAIGLISQELLDMIQDAVSRPIKWVDIRRFGRNLS